MLTNYVRKPAPDVTAAAGLAWRSRGLCLPETAGPGAMAIYPRHGKVENWGNNSCVISFELFPELCKVEGNSGGGYLDYQ